MLNGDDSRITSTPHLSYFSCNFWVSTFFFASSSSWLLLMETSSACKRAISDFASCSSDSRLLPLGSRLKTNGCNVHIIYEVEATKVNIWNCIRVSRSHKILDADLLKTFSSFIGLDDYSMETNLRSAKGKSNLHPKIGQILKFAKSALFFSFYVQNDDGCSSTKLGLSTEAV